MGIAPVTWTLRGRPQPLTVQDAKGRPLYGMTAEAGVTGAADLSVKQAVLSSVRVLRDYQALGTFPAEVADPARRFRTRPSPGRAIGWTARPDIASASRSLKGRCRRDHLTAASDGRIGLKITAVSGEAPLTPLPEASNCSTTSAEADAAARNALTFLSYQEKFLAGSWRFNTYFGRDTLMSVRLLMPALTPEAVEAGLGAVLTRLSPQGEVAHEEDIGEFAILDHLRAGQPKSDAPTFDYKMIDGSFMLAPVAAEWLLTMHAVDRRLRHSWRARTAAWARRRGPSAPIWSSTCRFVLQAAASFARIRGRRI